MFSLSKKNTIANIASTMKPVSIEDQIARLVRSKNEEKKVTFESKDIAESSSSDDEQDVKEDNKSITLPAPLANRGRTKLSGMSDEEKAMRQREQTKEWVANHSDDHRTYSQKYYAKNKETILAKRRAKRLVEKQIMAEHKHKQKLTQQV